MGALETLAARVNKAGKKRRELWRRSEERQRGAEGATAEVGVAVAVAVVVVQEWAQC